MDNKDKVRLLIRLARRVPEESPILLQWAEELLDAGTVVTAKNGSGPMDNGSRNRPSAPSSPHFPLAVFIETRTRRIDGILYSDCRVEMNGHSYNSPSQAATAELDYSEDGWRKIKFRDNGDGLVKPIDELRERGLLGRPKRRRR